MGRNPRHISNGWYLYRIPDTYRGKVPRLRTRKRLYPIHEKDEEIDTVCILILNNNFIKPYEALNGRNDCRRKYYMGYIDWQDKTISENKRGSTTEVKDFI
jgi:hypothetical protein